MALKYVASNTTYDFGKSEYTTTSNKYKRLNYIANGKTYQIGLATDATATQYSPLKMKINDNIYYIGRSSSRSSSTSYASTYSSRYVARVNTYTYSYATSSIRTETGFPYIVYHTIVALNEINSYYSNSTYSYLSTLNEYREEGQDYISTWESKIGYKDGRYLMQKYTDVERYINDWKEQTVTYTESESKTSYEYSTTTVSSSTSKTTSVASNNFV